MQKDNKRLASLKSLFETAIKEQDKSGMLYYGEKYFEELNQRPLNADDKEKLQNIILSSTLIEGND